MRVKKSPSALHTLKGKAKVRYILDYYKIPLFLAGVFLYVILWITMHRLTQKDVILYVGLVNTAPPEELALQLSDGYLEDAGYAQKESEVYLYRNLFLSSDANSEYHAYSYATRMKILGAIDAEHLDVVLMNGEAFDAFSQNGYLADLQKLFCPADDPDPSGTSQALYDRIKDGFRTNIRIEEDNSVEVTLGEESEYHAVTTEGSYGLSLSAISPMIQAANLSGTVYLGILENSPRQEEAAAYLGYLVGSGT